MKIESQIQVASAANRFDVYADGAESAVFFAGERKVLSIGRIKTGKFDESLGLAEKLRRHMANDALSAAMDSENVIPFGCEYRVKRHWKLAGNIVELTDDIAADNGGRISDLTLEDITFHGQAVKVEILFAGESAVREFAAEGMIYDGGILPVLVKVTFADGSAAEAYSGDDFWRHQCAATYAGGRAHHTIAVQDGAIVWRRQVLTVPEETEVEKRPWRFKSIFAVSGGNEMVPGGSMVTFDGCFAAAAKHRDFRSFIRKQPAGSSVAVTVSGGVFCSDGSHVSRPGKEVLHGMFGEIFDEYIWGGSAMARKGGSLVINSDIPAASGSVILKNMGRPAAELSFADMEEDFE